MIEDKKLGVKIAFNEEEALWENVRKEAEMLIKQSQNNLIVQKAMKKLAEKKLEKYDFGFLDKSEKGVKGK